MHVYGQPSVGFLADCHLANTYLDIHSSYFHDCRTAVLSAVYRETAHDAIHDACTDLAIITSNAVWDYRFDDSRGSTSTTSHTNTYRWKFLSNTRVHDCHLDFQ